MVPSIESQIHQALVEKEELRCREIEENNLRQTGVHKRIKRRKITMPKVRLGECAICQEPDLLLMVSQYDYDLEDRGFQDYCIGRGVFHVTGSEGSKRREYMQNYDKPYSDFVNESLFWPDKPRAHSTIEVREYMDTQWKIICIGRGKLQDCWQLYRKAQSDKRP